MTGIFIILFSLPLGLLGVPLLIKHPGRDIFRQERELNPKMFLVKSKKNITSLSLTQTGQPAASADTRGFTVSGTGKFQVPMIKAGPLPTYLLRENRVRCCGTYYQRTSKLRVWARDIGWIQFVIQKRVLLSTRCSRQSRV